MPPAIDTVSGFVTAPGATFTAWTLATGDALQVRNAPFDKAVRLVNFWAFNQVAGTLRVRSPRIHDNVQGVRMNVLANDVEAFIPYHFPQKLIPQDILIAEQTGSAVGGQIESGSLLLYYEDLPGIAGRYITVDVLAKRLANVFTQEVSITPGAAGGYSGAAAINANFDLMKANTDYALMGYMVSARCSTLAIRGADSGNLRVSGPGEPSQRYRTVEWFVRHARLLGLPLVPIFNSANKAGITVDVVQNQAATAVTATLVMAELLAG